MLHVEGFDIVILVIVVSNVSVVITFIAIIFMITVIHTTITIAFEGEILSVVGTTRGLGFKKEGIPGMRILSRTVPLIQHYIVPFLSPKYKIELNGQQSLWGCLLGFHASLRECHW